MPAVVNSTVGSFSGMTDALGMRAWPFSSKKRRNRLRSSLADWMFMGITSLSRYRGTAQNIAHLSSQGRTDALRGTTLIDSCMNGRILSISVTGKTAAPFPARGVGLRAIPGEPAGPPSRLPPRTVRRLSESAMRGAFPMRLLISTPIIALQNGGCQPAQCENYDGDGGIMI